MIDPKFNEIEDPTLTDLDEQANAGLSGNTSAAAKPRRGLSINDTVAADANLSVGSRGTDTSGVRAGAGAGAGSTFVTPGSTGESPAANVVPGPRGSGITPLSTANPEQIPTPGKGQPYATTPETTSTGSTSTTPSRENYGTEKDTYVVTNDEIAAYAYQSWVERGSPHGSAEEDWHRAERELRERARRPKTSSANA